MTISTPTWEAYVAAGVTYAECALLGAFPITMRT